MSHVSIQMTRQKRDYTSHTAYTFWHINYLSLPCPPFRIVYNNVKLPPVNLLMVDYVRFGSQSCISYLLNYSFIKMCCHKRLLNSIINTKLPRTPWTTCCLLLISWHGWENTALLLLLNFNYWIICNQSIFLGN